VPTNPFGAIELPTQLFLSFALGHAASPAIEPFAQSLANTAWSTHAVVPPNAILLAQGVAQGQVARADAYTWAKEQGFDTAQMDAMVNIANVGPGASYAFELWRRGRIDNNGFNRALRRLGLEQEWIDAMDGLHDVLLSSPELAMAQQQGFVDLQRSNDEALLQGVTNERQQIRFEMAGLPPGVETALAMLRRNIIGQPEFAQIVREGHTKTKYTDELLKLQTQVLSAATYVRAHLKGHATQQQMYDGGALTGYSPNDLDLWYLTEGRPATAHQIHIGYQRGASLPGASSEQDAIATAVKQSDIRPEYTELIYAGRDTFPSLFQLNRLVAAGAINPATAADWATKSGTNAGVVNVLEQYWQTLGGGTGTSGELAKAQTQLWTTTHTAYKNAEIDQAEAQANFALLGINAADQQGILRLWNAERDTFRKQLTPTQLKKAWKGAALNPATNTAWTRDDALNALLARGYSPNDANTFLEL
jgi:hypothetical protein